MNNQSLACIHFYALSSFLLLGARASGQIVEDFQIGAQGIYGSVNLGNATAIEGEWAVLGDYGGSPRFGIATGTCTVSRRTEHGWVPWQTLSPAVNVSGQQFGYSVAIHGDEIVVGARGGGPDRAGRVHIFRLVGDEWIETQKLRAFDGANPFAFGESVAFDEETLVVGSHGYPGFGTNANYYGAVYVYERVAERWAHVQQILAPDVTTTPHGYWGAVGQSCSVDGDILAIGAGSEGQGMVFVYRRTSTGWLRESDLYLPQFAPHIAFALGTSVDVSGTTIAVGAPSTIDAFSPGPSSVWIFDYNEQLGQWEQTQWFRASDWNLAPPGKDLFGERVSLRGDRLLVGAKYGKFNGPLSGTAYLFERSNGVWEEVERYVASDPNDYPGGMNTPSMFGSSVALDGTSNRMIIGSEHAYAPDYFTGPPWYAWPFAGKGYFFDLNQGRVVCDGALNLTGTGTRFTVTGNRQVGDANLSLSVYDAPPGFAGIFLVGPGGTPMPFGATGSLCVGQPFARLTGIRTIGPGGSAMHEVDFTTPPASGLLFPGATLTFQFAHRDIDSASGQQTINASDAVQVVFE